MPGLLVVALEPVGAAQALRATRYPVRLGPLRFQCVVGEVPETLGDKLDAVGATLVVGERAPRPAQITLPVSGSFYEVDDRTAGLILRRQVRALLNNAAWRPHGLYFEAGWDPETAAWLAVGGGQLTDEDRGWNFGDWQLALSDAYLAGRPATHRRGRRIGMVDRAAAGIPHDSRRLLTSTDLAVATGEPPAVIPAPVDGVTGWRDREPVLTAGPTVAGRTLWNELVPAGDSEQVTWRAAPTALPDPREREAAAEDPGSVRVWATTPVLTTPDGDTDPEAYYGWERILGDLDRHTQPLAIDNGWARLRWLGGGPDQGLLLERVDPDTGRYLSCARVLHRQGEAEVRAVEITSERALISWRTGGQELRAELRRGWGGPRLEAYAPSGADATLAIAVPGGTVLSGGTPFVTRITRLGTPGVTAGRSHSGVAFSTNPTDPIVDGQTGKWVGTRVFVLQVDVHGKPAVDVRALARWDVRSDPTIIPA